MSQEKTKALLEGAIKDAMPTIMDMVTNHKYPIVIERTSEGFRMTKDGSTWEPNEEMMTNLKLFINMFYLTKNAQQKRGQTSDASGVSPS